MTVETDRIHRVGIDRLFVVSPRPPHDLGCDGLQRQFGLCTGLQRLQLREGSDSSHVKIRLLGVPGQNGLVGQGVLAVTNPTGSASSARRRRQHLCRQDFLIGWGWTNTV